MSTNNGDWEELRCLRFANAFRDQAAQIEKAVPAVAAILRENARTAERAAGRIRLKNLTDTTVH